MNVEMEWIAWRRRGLTSEQVDADLASIERNETLAAAYLDQNKLTTVPTELFKLKRLQQLYLDENKIASFNPDQMTGLRMLHMENNQLETLPSSMTKLQQLRRYVVTGI